MRPWRPEALSPSLLQNTRAANHRGACSVPAQGNHLSFRVPGLSRGWSHVLLCDQ